MAAPKSVSRKRFAEWKGVRWNAFVELCFSDINDLTLVQRLPHLVFWYSNEVHNGGHYQYFVNKRHFDHSEVVRALHALGANDYANNLTAALIELGDDPIAWPDTVGQFLAGERDIDLSRYDTAFYKCTPKIESWLGDYLDKHEEHFIEWIP